MEERRLAAIMFTDIAGYTAMMGNDTKRAIEFVRRSKEIQRPLVEKYSGKWLKEMGDGLLIQFNTALDAVNCALEIQKTCHDDFEAQLRIGVHLGDITIEKDDVYGDGVNVAARLQSVADPGGIYISESIEMAIRGQIKVKVKFLGEIRLKNVIYGVRTYALQESYLPIPKVKNSRIFSGRFWAELHRRNVLLAGITYVIFSILVIIIFAQFQFPASIEKVILILLIVGFPISIYLAWNYEFSPEGFVRTSSKESWQNPFESSQKKPMTNNYVIIGLLLIIIIALTLTKVNILSSSIPSISNDKSIAVLPFYDLSPNQDQEYFSIGVMDEIMNNLFMIGDLTLPSRTAVMRYKDSNKTIKEIGDELNVSYLLEGSVLRSNNLVRLIVRLVDVESGKSIWSQDYEESVEDVMELQIKIATEVSSSLNTQISQNLKKIIETKPTENIDALILYWKGRENRDLYFKNLDKLYLDKAIDYYNMAYEIDSVFASALVGLAEAIWEKEFVENFYKEFVIDSVKNLCNKAIELNPNIAEAYFIRAKCHREKSDFNKQHSDLEKTIRLNPNHAGAYVMVGEYLFMIEDDYGQALKNFSQALRRSKEEELGDIFKQYCFLFLDLGMFEKAEYYGKKEIEINQGGQALFWVYFHQGKFREAKNEAERFQLLYPDRERGLYHLAISSLFLEDFKTANIFFKKLIELLESNGEAHSLNRYRDRYGYLLWETGYQDQAIQQFELSIRYLKSTEVLKRSMTRDNYAYHLAATECFLGNFDESYYWLEKMNEFGWHWGYPFHIERDPMFDNLKDKSKFQAIIKKAQDEKTALRVQINEMEQNGEIDL